MQLTILGSSASYAGPGQACSGYLLRDEGVSICLDLGNGSLSNLFKHIDPKDLDLILISHPHMDHFADIFSLKQYLTYNGTKDKKLKMILPESLLARIVLLSEQSEAGFRQVFDFLPVPAGQTKEFTQHHLKIKLQPVEHYELSSYAVAVTGSKKVVYTGDLKLTDDVDELIQKADLLIAEATLREGDLPNKGHLSGGQAGQLASRNHVGTLVISHFWPAFERTGRLEEAAEQYSGKVIEAKENLVIEV